MPIAKTARRLLTAALAAASLPAAETAWTHVSSTRGEVPDPAGSHQQTGALVARLDKGKADGLVISYRVRGPALLWIRRAAAGWQRIVIEPEFLRVEAGGAAHDIDADGDLDIVFGADSQGNQMWWWENPYPNFDPATPWKRRLIKNSGANQHHDQIFADVKGTGRPHLVFWNQKAKTLFLAEIPDDPRASGPWTLEPVFSGQAGEQVGGAAQYAEGVDAFDVDGDGKLDLLAGNHWFQRQTGGAFLPVKVGEIGGRIRAGKFRPGKTAQIVIAPGDGSGPLRIYEATGDPAKSASWAGRDLLDRDMVHGHTLDIGDIDGDGRLDIFAAEMAKWTNQPGVDHPAATAWILYGDGKGGFRRTVLRTGDGWHEGKLGDFDGDGDLDIANKPYTWTAPRLDFWLNTGPGAKR